MLRLTEIRRAPAEIVLKAEGQVVGDWVAVLEDECRKFLTNRERVLLDLGQVTYADRNGVRLLRRLARERISIINCAPLVRDLLAEEAL